MGETSIDEAICIRALMTSPQRITVRDVTPAAKFTI